MRPEDTSVGVLCADPTETSSLIAWLREGGVLPGASLRPLSPSDAAEACGLRGVVLALPCDRPVALPMLDALAALLQAQTPRLVFLDGIDAPGANPFARFIEIREGLGASPLMLQLPAPPPPGGSPWGVIDLLRMTTRRPGREAGYIPQELGEQAGEYREALVDSLSCSFPEISEAWSGDTLTPGLLEATCARASALPGEVLVALGASSQGAGLAPLGGLVSLWLG
jgi:hypothetical protein